VFSMPLDASADTLGVPWPLVHRLLTLITTLTARAQLDKFFATGVRE
jgi:hypothetical protein